MDCCVEAVVHDSSYPGRQWQIHMLHRRCISRYQTRIWLECLQNCVPSSHVNIYSADDHPSSRPSLYYQCGHLNEMVPLCLWLDILPFDELFFSTEDQALQEVNGP